MKGRLYLLATLCAILSGCNQNTPDDPTTKNQPANPSTWSPAGHKYVSVDSTCYGRYIGRFLTFETDSVSGFFGKLRYRLQYPLIYVGDDSTPAWKFIDTLNVTKAYELSDDASLYVLIY